MQTNKEVHYICTYWGCEHQSAKEFLSHVIENGYNGVEINFPDDPHFISEFMDELEKIRKNSHPNFLFIGQQVLPLKKESIAEYTQRLTERLRFLTSLKPNAINSHTGKDYYDFDDNCQIIEIAEEIASQAGIPLWHEIHRGRFSFHLKTLLNYLDKYPTLKLVADFSHFCVVSESDLSDQQEVLSRIYPHIQHIHARVGFEEGPQLNNPFAPEWKAYLEHYLAWWKDILDLHTKRHSVPMTITPEFGPYPYMPQEPFTKKPLSIQWDINLQMKKFLQQNL
ncbi:sugar phosphate isomerase/epimerase family protein [Aquirufa sp. ROCK2-A2]